MSRAARVAGLLVLSGFLASLPRPLTYQHLCTNRRGLGATPRVGLLFILLFAMRHLVPIDWLLSLAARAGAVDSAVRESSRSFTGWVVEPVFESYESASDFARRASAVVGVGVVVRRWVPVAWHSVTFTQPWACSVPCEMPGRVLSLGIPSRGSRVVVES